MPKKVTEPKKSSQDWKVVYMRVDQLLLDSENPRLASSTGANTQEELLRVLWTEMAVDEVALSIAENGFFPEEPLFVIPETPTEKDEKKRKYRVVEGNRRLAAVLLLRDDALRARLRATDLPTLTLDKKEALYRLPVSIYATREDLWEYFGFRHINGPKEWDAFSKSQYVAKVHEDYGVSLEEIARKIGDYHSTVKRLYRGNQLLRQAETMAGFDKKDRIRNRFYFSHLYTAADQPEFQRFLGIDPKKSLGPNPVPRSKIANLSELMLWLYGSRSAEKAPIVAKQDPDLNILRQVISNPSALSAIRAGYSLDRSYQIARGDKRRFREALTSAKEDLVQANGAVTTGYSGEEDLYRIMEDILTIAEKIRDEMKDRRSKPSSRGRKS